MNETWPIAVPSLVCLDCGGSTRNGGAEFQPRREEHSVFAAARLRQERDGYDGRPLRRFLSIRLRKLFQAAPYPTRLAEFDEFSNLREYNLQVLLKILEAAAAAKAPMGSDQQKIGDSFASCMDTAAIEKRGLAVLQPELEIIGAVRDKSALPPLLAQLQKMEVNAFFEVGSQQDYQDATKEIAVVDQGGLGLPEKDYYLRTDPKSVELRQEYVQHLTNLLKLMGESGNQAASDAKAVMDLETSLAKVSMGAVERRDPKNVYHFMPVDQLAAQAPILKLKEVLNDTGVPPVTSLNVASPEFFKGLQSIVDHTDLETIKTYLRIRLVDSETMRLPKAFDDEHFNFYGRQLEGTPQQEQRSKRCVSATDAGLGEVLGKFYVAEYFAGDSKAKTLELVKQIEVIDEPRHRTGGLDEPCHQGQGGGQAAPCSQQNRLSGKMAGLLQAEDRAR